MVDYLRNGSKATSVLSLHEEDDTADLDEAPRGGLDINVGHPGNLSAVSVGVSVSERRVGSTCVCAGANLC